MSKLFLSSSFADVADLFGNWIDGPGKGKSVTFISAASIPEAVKFYVKTGRKALEKLGFTIDELDIRTAGQEEMEKTFQRNDFIYVSGGNTFFLLQEMERTGAGPMIVEQIKSGTCYIGESAGSVLLSPDIEYVKHMDSCKKAPGLKGFEGLNVVDFYPLPHYTNFPFKRAVEKTIAAYDRKINLYPITNDQAIVVDGDKIEVIGK